MKNKIFLWILILVLALAILICCAVKIYTTLKTLKEPASSANYQSDFTYEIPAVSDGTTWFVHNGEITPVKGDTELQEMISEAIAQDAK